MELVLKIHGKISDPAETPIQMAYGDTNIGFEKLGELTNRGLSNPVVHNLPFADAWMLCEAENKAGRFPLISLPTESRKSFFGMPERIAPDASHIFITVWNQNQGLILVGHACGATHPIIVPDPFEIERQILGLELSFQVSLVA